MGSMSSHWKYEKSTSNEHVNRWWDHIMLLKETSYFNFIFNNVQIMILKITSVINIDKYFIRFTNRTHKWIQTDTIIDNKLWL